MKERGILFSGPMVKAIQSGAKTQTRRAAKDQVYIEKISQTPFNPLCIYGKVGDRLYVRETFCKLDKNHVIDSEYNYKADATPLSEEMRLDFVKAGYPYKWTSSIFMPRAASRITLEITNVWLETLQCISEEDAIAEGITLPNYAEQAVKDVKYPEPSEIFMDLWIKINGKKSWDSDPWVWVLKFKVIES